MSVQASTVTVGTTATLLASPATTDSDGISVQFTPPSTIYIGGAGVTSSTGYALTAGVEYNYDLRAGDALYAAVAASTVAVPVFCTGL